MRTEVQLLARCAARLVVLDADRRSLSAGTAGTQRSRVRRRYATLWWRRRCRLSDGRGCCSAGSTSIARPRCAHRRSPLPARHHVMCGIVAAVARATSSRSCSRACGAWSTAATTPPASRSSTARSEAPAQPAAAWPQLEKLAERAAASPAPSASPTRAGRRTARPPSATPIRTSAAASRWCTTASSRTTTRCARGCSALGYEFTSDTDTEVIAHLVHSMLPSGRRLFEAVQAAPQGAERRLRHRRDRARTIRSGWSSRAWARRCCSAWARARTSPPPTPPRCCR